MRPTAAFPALAAVSAAVLAASMLGQAPAAGRPAARTTIGPTGRVGVALARLAAESTGSVRVTRGPTSVARFVGLTGESRDPAVRAGESRRQAARAHLTRYGAALGLDDHTRLTAGRVVRADTGDDVVRFDQRRGGLRVIGGSVAVDLRPDRQLGSVMASLSRATVPGASYDERRAAREALALVRRESGHGVDLRVHRRGRWLYDPAVTGVARTGDPTTHARGVWRFEVTGGPGLRHLVLVDDRTGTIVRDVDEIEDVQRVVCDGENFQAVDVPCTQDFVRSETGPASDVPDANSAFDLAGMVSDFYSQIGGIDLTSLIGIDLPDHTRALGSTVRYCDPQLPCPLQNAFWNGTQMFYGDGFAGADDVVGHEMTHGVIAKNANLLYWGQSGAINESLADVMGEIMDHRHPGPGDTPDSWTIGEDLPVGILRSLADPPAYQQPDSMLSNLYSGGTDDNGGVHTNSGVGNKAFYLISQGGLLNGQLVTGIDDPTLTKTATLYLSVIQHLTSGSDYRDLADALEQGCADLAAGGIVGFTTTDCATVAQAVRATRMRRTPVDAPQPHDAPMTCPTGRVRVLFDSETGDPAAKFRAGPSWRRAPGHNLPANATSGRESWYSRDPDAPRISPLSMTTPVALPAHQRSYLWFQHWWVLDFLGSAGFDGGVVKVGDASTRGGAHNAAGLPWVNGPVHRVVGRYGNPAGNPRAFVRDSHGWLASRLDLTSYAGDAVRPSFVMTSDKTISFPGWYLDDIRVYTCGSALYPTAPPHISGSARTGHRLRANVGAWSQSDLGFRLRWLRDGHPIPHTDRATYVVRRADRGHRLSVRVTAFPSGHHRVATRSTATARVP